MKIFVLIGLLVIFSSCERKYSCYVTCWTDGSVLFTDVEKEIKAKNKKEAKEKCDKETYTNASLNGGCTGTLK